MKGDGDNLRLSEQFMTGAWWRLPLEQLHMSWLPQSPHCRLRPSLSRPVQLPITSRYTIGQQQSNLCVSFFLFFFFGGGGGYCTGQDEQNNIFLKSSYTRQITTTVYIYISTILRAKQIGLGLVSLPERR